MINVGIVGYGNIGRALERSVSAFPDIKLFGIFSRRAPLPDSPLGSRMLSLAEASDYEDKIDVLIVAHGSRTDAPKTVRELLRHFNTVDSFDMHRDITKHRKNAEKVAKNCNKLSVVSSGWDPGLMSLMRAYFSAFMPYAAVNSFWGEGISQGHSEALRGIEGVKDAVQYTVPNGDAICRAEMGEAVNSRSSHRRICYIAADGDKHKAIEYRVRNMRGYFSGYDVEIRFVSEEEVRERCSSLYHKGRVIASGLENGFGSTAELKVELDSNPDFTAHILLSTARAAMRLYKEGKRGALTLLDIPPRYYLPYDADMHL